MIVIDGRESTQHLSNFSNLEEALVQLLSTEAFEERIVTDVLVNDEAFSELYPHQAEDIASEDISRLEVRTVSIEEMATDVVEELPKVIKLISVSSRDISTLFRKSEISEGLELLQDMISVGSAFINTLQVLRDRFSTTETTELINMGNTLSDLLSEMTEAMADEDWMLVADLLEFEFLPACQGWSSIIESTRSDIKHFQEQ